MSTIKLELHNFIGTLVDVVIDDLEGKGLLTNTDWKVESTCGFDVICASLFSKTNAFAE